MQKLERHVVVRVNAGRDDDVVSTSNLDPLDARQIATQANHRRVDYGVDAA